MGGAGMHLKKVVTGNQAPTRQNFLIHSHLMTLSAVHEKLGRGKWGGDFEVK